MPAKAGIQCARRWTPAFAGVTSSVLLNVFILVDIHLDAAGRETLNVGRGGLALRAAEASLDRRHVVEMQRCDEVEA